MVTLALELTQQGIYTALRVSVELGANCPLAILRF